jgi:hypothetical protein
MNDEEAGCEDAIKAQTPVKFVGHTSSLARLANRLNSTIMYLRIMDLIII